MMVEIVTPRYVPEHLDIELDELTQVVFMLMVEEGTHISCANLGLPRYWSVNWESCPLCGSWPVDGRMYHKSTQ